MKTKFTLQELKDKRIAIKCDTQEQADKVICAIYGRIVELCNSWELERPFVYFNGQLPNFIDNALYQRFMLKERIDASEFLIEDESEVKEPEPIPTEYAVLTNATESAKKQIAEFEQALAQIKIDAMKLGSRDLARLIKVLKEI